MDVTVSVELVRDGFCPLHQFFIGEGVTPKEVALKMNPFEQVRSKLNISKKELSAVLNISHMTIDQAEHGLIKRPSRYAQALEQAGLVESANQLLTDQQAWLVKLQGERLQQLKERS